MSACSSMSHRATVERSTPANTGWGNPGPDSWAPSSVDVRCRAWYDSGREQTGVEGKTAEVELVRAIFPLGTDITSKDRLDSVRDRLGNVVFPGPLKVEAVGRRADHIPVTLEVPHG